MWAVRPDPSGQRQNWGVPNSGVWGQPHGNHLAHGTKNLSTVAIDMCHEVVECGKYEYTLQGVSKESEKQMTCFRIEQILVSRLRSGRSSPDMDFFTTQQNKKPPAFTRSRKRMLTSPSGKKFRSKPQLARYLGSSMDLSTFDFRTGKMLMSKMNKNRQRMRYDCSNQAKGKPDLNTALPVRQTASIFKQPVTKITNHPSNKVKSDPQKAVDQPRQLFWEKKLSGLNAFDIAEELVKTMDLPKGLQGVGPGCTDETLLSAIASALHTSTMPITGQLSAAVEKNPGVWLNTSQPLCKAFMVTDEDIRKQEELVQQRWRMYSPGSTVSEFPV
ncbi:methyl-CpG-binding domain protein 3 [Alligator mississippiensis]|uniref:Methyl-CpG-binding domain protein 3 n=1 Tax=Alligator mississippiensis TaxID=8496 RepID=A0A151NHL4_ALLMI|nr:methyl-CpG-binding domain protein 3 [Alligator mississippiensis]